MDTPPSTPVFDLNDDDDLIEGILASLYDDETPLESHLWATFANAEEMQEVVVSEMASELASWCVAEHRESLDTRQVM